MAEMVITALSHGNEYLPARDIHLEHHYVHFPTSDNDPNAPDRGIKWEGIKGTQLELFLINLPALTLLLLRQVRELRRKKKVIGPKAASGGKAGVDVWTDWDGRSDRTAKADQMRRITLKKEIKEKEGEKIK